MSTWKKQKSGFSIYLSHDDNFMRIPVNQTVFKMSGGSQSISLKLIAFQIFLYTMREIVSISNTRHNHLA